MASEIRVNRLSNRSGLSTITFANGGVQFSGITTFANGEFYVGTGATIINPSSNEFNFHTGGSNRFTINNSGVNLGTGNITAVDGTFTGNVSIAKTLTYEDVKNVDSVGVVTARTGVKITGGDFTVGTAITASSVTGNVTQDVGITTYSGSAVWFKGATANKDMYWSHASGATVYKDNAQILMGDSSDLQIYHSGSHSFIKDAGTGMLKICADMIDFRNAADNATLAYAQEGNKFELFYAGNAKLATTNTGVTITGRATAGGLTLNDGGASSPILSVRADDTNPWAFIFGNDTYNSSAGLYGLQNNGGDFLIRMRGNGEYKGINIERWDGTTNQSWVDLSSAGGVNVKYQGSTKLSTKTEGISVEGSVNLEGSQNTQPSHGGMQRHTNGWVYFTGKSDGSGASLSNGDGTATVRAVSPGGSNGYVTMESGNGTERLRITSAGRLGIGIQAPTKLLDIATSTSADGIRIKSTGNTYNELSFDANRTSASTHLGRIISHWNGTAVSYISMDAGSDTTNKDDGIIRFWTAADNNGCYERLRIATNGSVGVNVTNPQVYDPAARALVVGEVDGYGHTGMTIRSNGTDKQGAIYFADGTGSSSYRGRIEYLHTDDSLRFGTAGGGNKVNIASNGRVQIANGGDLYVVGSSYNATLNGNILSFDRAGYSYIDQTSNSGALSFRVGASAAQILRLDTTNAIFPQGTLYLGTQNTSSGHLNAYELMTFNIDTDNDDTNRYFAFYKDGASGSGTKLFHIGEDGVVQIPATNDNKLLLTGSSNPYIQFQESTTNKAFIQWNAGGYFHIVNQEDSSALKLKDNFEFSDNNSDFHKVHHDDYFGHWGDDYTSVWVGTQNASTTVRDDEKDKWYRIEISEASWSGGCNTLDIVRANVHQNSAVHGNWYGSLDARIQFRTSHCGHGANYVRWVHHYSSSPPSGGFIGKTNAYLSCGESSRMIVWLRGQASYQIRVNGRKAHVRTSSGGSTQGGPDNTSQINATELWDPITSVQASSVMAIGNDRYWYAKSLRYGGQGATGAGVKCEAVSGGIDITGNLSKDTGSFRIPHPLVGLSTTKNLVHSFIEGPQMDLIYRGKVDLVNGTASVNIDTKTGMTEGTFVALNRDVQCFTTNETGWTNIKGSVTGNIITIVAQDNTCTDTISWMVVGERQDDKAKESILTDNDGNLIVEPDQEPITEEDFGGTPLENQTDEQVSIMNSMMN